MTCSGPLWHTSDPSRVALILGPARSTRVRKVASSVWQRTTPSPPSKPDCRSSAFVAHRELPYAWLVEDERPARATTRPRPAPASAPHVVIALALRKSSGARVPHACAHASHPHGGYIRSSPQASHGGPRTAGSGTWPATYCVAIQSAATDATATTSDATARIMERPLAPPHRPRPPPRARARGRSDRTTSAPRRPF